MLSQFHILQWKKICKVSVDFWNRKMTLKMRIAVLLTFKTQKNARPRIVLYTKLERGLSLFTPELSYAQVFNWGHANIYCVRRCHRNLVSMREKFLLLLSNFIAVPFLDHKRSSCHYFPILDTFYDYLSVIIDLWFIPTAIFPQFFDKKKYF